MFAVFSRFAALLAVLFGFVLVYSHFFRPAWRAKMHQQVSKVAWAFVLMSAVYIVMHWQWR